MSLRDSQPDDTSEVERFAEAWDAFVLAIRRAQARGPQSPDDLTLAQYYLLSPLLDERGVPLSRLAESAGIAPPTATRIIDGMEKAELVRRERSKTDRRAVLVSLTQTGRRRVARKRSQLADRRRRLYENLEPDERRHSEQLLRHLAEQISQL